MLYNEAWQKAETWARELPHHDWYVVEYSRNKFDAVRKCDLTDRMKSVSLAYARNTFKRMPFKIAQS